MISFPNCKINIWLNVIRKREDGYHDLESVFYPVPLTDILEITTYRAVSRNAPFPFTLTGLPVEGIPSTNICIKAYKLLKNDFPELPFIQLHLHKIIPTGAGLGGGSADGAFTLQILNELFELGLSTDQLLNYSAQLGSDCPFFIINKPCLANGRGEVLEQIKVNLEDYKLLIVNPGLKVYTGDVFRFINPEIPEVPLKQIIAKPVSEWKHFLKNDFEKIVFKTHPGIVEIKDELYRRGAIFASMSGSGSTVYGLFPRGESIDISFASGYFIKEFSLS